MMLTLRSILLCSVICAGSLCCYGKAWRDIVPLRSTRADVLKLLGTPHHLQWDYRDYFEVENAIVTFQWIDPNCVRKYPVEPTSAVMPEDLVLNISVSLTRPLTEKELKIPQGKIWFTDCLGSSPNGPWICTFMDNQEGFAFTTSHGGVTGLSYSASKQEFQDWKDTHSQCISIGP